jgi:hypothetical protein
LNGDVWFVYRLAPGVLALKRKSAVERSEYLNCGKQTGLLADRGQ